MLSAEKQASKPVVSYRAQRQQRKHIAKFGSAAPLTDFQKESTNKESTRSISSHLQSFARSHWRFLGSLVLAVVACILILYAEIARGWNEALFLRVRRAAIETTCEPQEKYDTELVYVSCPIVYMHDFRNQLAGTFLKDIASDIDLSGLSIELKTEIYQWREIAHCDGCEPQFQDADGNCISGHRFTSCRYTFEKAWVHEPVASSSFACAEGDKRCEFPAGGFAAVMNEGYIPSGLKSFKKLAETVSIGTNPGRYYLSPELIAQLPSRTNPLFFPKDGLPTVSGRTTSLVGSHNHEELRLEKHPSSSDPSIGDVRSRVSMTDFYNRDSERVVSVVARQAPYIHGSRHRTLASWDSGSRSWENGAEMQVAWLREGDTSLDSIISDERAIALKDVLNTIISLRIGGFTCVLLALLLLFSPLAKVWANKRNRTGRFSAVRDILLVLSIFMALAIVAACTLAALPWLHYWPFCGGILLTTAALLFIQACVMLKFLDSWANLQIAMLEWRRIDATASGFDASLPGTSVGEENSHEDQERGLFDNDAMSLNSRLSVEHYGAVDEPSGLRSSSTSVISDF